MFVSTPFRTPPDSFSNKLQSLVYKTLNERNIPFLRVECEDGTTMESCREIDAALDAKTVKTLFLCNRQKTVFYLYVTEGSKPFVTKEFSAALGVSRVSFAPEEILLEKMGTKVGATTVFSCLLESSAGVRLVIDKTVLDEESFCCTDGTNTAFVKFSTTDLKERLLPMFDREAEII